MIKITNNKLIKDGQVNKYVYWNGVCYQTITAYCFCNNIYVHTHVYRNYYTIQKIFIYFVK